MRDAMLGSKVDGGDRRYAGYSNQQQQQQVGIWSSVLMTRSAGSSNGHPQHPGSSRKSNDGKTREIQKKQGSLGGAV